MENLAFTALHKGLLRVCRETFKISVRYGNRINVQKPRPSHYDRAKIEHLTRHRYFEKGERESWFIPQASQCLKEKEISLKQQSKNEENPYEKLLAKELREWFLKSKLIAFFHANPPHFEERFEVEVRLRKEDMYLKNYGKHTVDMALEGTPYKSAMCLFVSHTDMVFCSEPKIDKLLKVATKMHQHVLLAAIVEGRFLSVSQMKALSQVKDLTTARAQLVGVLSAAQSQLVRGLTYHQRSIVAGLQQLAGTGGNPSSNQSATAETSSNPTDSQSSS